MADDVSLPMPAKGVVASLEEADVTSIGAGNAGAVGAVGVFWIELGLSEVDGLWTIVSTTPGGAIVAPAELLDGLGVVGSECLFCENRGDWVVLPPLLDGTVLLLCTPLVGVAGVGVLGGKLLSDRLLCLLDTETFLRMLPHFLTLSAATLELDPDLPITVLDLFGVVGVPGGFAGVPLCTSRTVSGSAAVPCMPIKKLS